MKNIFLSISVCVLAGLAVCRASELEPALKQFAGYEFGQPKNVLHATRMTAFRGTHEEQVRLENEQLLLAFIQSDASTSARREACLWLSELGTEAGRPVLTGMLEVEEFADAAQIALDALAEKGTVEAPQPAHRLAQFKAEVAASGEPSGLLIDAMKGTDEARARLAFNLVADGVAQPEVCKWVEEHVQSLETSRQIVAMNLLVQVSAKERVPVLETLSREGQGDAKLVAIRHLGGLERKEDAAYLVGLFCGTDVETAEASRSALRATPETVVQDSLLECLKSVDPAVQAKAIELVELRGFASAAGELWRTAEQDGNPNQKTAIRALGKTAPASDYGRLLDGFISRKGTPVQKEWQMAVWDMSRRHPDYGQALAMLKSEQANAPAETAGPLASLAAKLETFKTASTPNELDEALKLAKKEKDAANSNILLPGSYHDLVPKRFGVAAYLNCGPGKKTTQNGVSIECINGKPSNSSPGTDPSLSVLFAGSTLDFTIAGLESGQDYVLGVTWWDVDFNDRRQAIHINGEEVLPNARAMAFEERNPATPKSGRGRPTPTRIQFALLPEQFQDGTCKITMKGAHEPNVVTSELWVAKRSKPRAEKQILLVSGQDFPGHHWRKTGPVMESLITQDERMEVTICETPYALGLKHLDVYDAVFVHFKNYEPDLPSTKQMQENLKTYVLNGGGMCMSHFACGAFMEWPEFVTLSGRIWSRGGHDPRGPFTVKVVDPDHPVTRGLGDAFETDDELYWCLTGEPEIHLLCTAMSTAKKADQPQALVFEPGQGRTFLCTLGHDVKAYDSDKVKQLYRQGAAWAAGLE